MGLEFGKHEVKKIVSLSKSMGLNVDDEDINDVVRDAQGS